MVIAIYTILKAGAAFVPLNPDLPLGRLSYMISDAKLTTILTVRKFAFDINGKGMTQEVKEKIFDYLYTTKGVGKGTGLGLAIARQIIVEKHNERIDVNSTPGQGSEFIIQLPV